MLLQGLLLRDLEHLHVLPVLLLGLRQVHLLLPRDRGLVLQALVLHLAEVQALAGLHGAAAEPAVRLADHLLQGGGAVLLPGQ